MIPDEILKKIEVYSEERRVAHASGEPELARSFDDKIAELYDKLRRTRAEQRYGTRKEISKAARTERELEKLTG